MDIICILTKDGLVNFVKHGVSLFHFVCRTKFIEKDGPVVDSIVVQQMYCPV